ncbi:peptidoglycan-binding protein [Streptomyces violaceusniger]|uniref:Hydrolase n=1 Tax=Streptomyces violaceusniger TaxID=68280 RepID=A0A4D4LRP2_STRVO|nr:hydrolase [Streptomyces violaceusniger]
MRTSLLRRSAVAVLGALVATVAAGNLLSGPGTASAAPAAESQSVRLHNVRLAQTDLNGLAYPAGRVDGISGPRTKAAARTFQSDRCLSVDGIVGPQTLGSLKDVVKKVQAKAGAAPNGLYGPSTANAVKAYQRKHQLAVDGIAGPDTMKSMGIARTVSSCKATDGIRSRVVQAARGQLGTRENASNCVPGKPYSICDSWCAAFATWVWRQAGAQIPSINLVPGVYDWAVSHHKWAGPSQLASAKPGDLIIYGSASNRYHIGVVERANGSTASVISGNTSDPSGSGRDGVYAKSLSLTTQNFYGLVRL